jgi:hypothetical protein
LVALALLTALVRHVSDRASANHIAAEHAVAEVLRNTHHLILQVGGDRKESVRANLAVPACPMCKVQQIVSVGGCTARNEGQEVDFRRPVFAIASHSVYVFEVCFNGDLFSAPPPCCAVQTSGCKSSDSFSGSLLIGLKISSCSAPAFSILSSLWRKSSKMSSALRDIWAAQYTLCWKLHFKQSQEQVKTVCCWLFSMTN